MSSIDMLVVYLYTTNMLSLICIACTTKVSKVSVQVFPLPNNVYITEKDIEC
jgi:hypothetical protein